MRTLLIHNPIAARSGGGTVRAVAAELDKAVDVTVAGTRAPGHATELVADALAEGCELVVVLGGDGTANEALQALAGTEVPIAPLPSGSTNVWARRLGFGTHARSAASELVLRIERHSYRRVALGMAGARWFACNAGFGLDAAVVRRVDRRPRRKRVLGQAAFLTTALAMLLRGYGNPRIEVKTEDTVTADRLETVVCTTNDPFTYLGRLPVRLAPGAVPDLGMNLLGLTNVGVTTLARVLWSGVAGDVRRLSSTRLWHNLAQATLSSDEPLPLQVDGDAIGDTTSVDLRSIPDAVTVPAPPQVRP